MTDPPIAYSFTSIAAGFRPELFAGSVDAARLSLYVWFVGRTNANGGPRRRGTDATNRRDNERGFVVLIELDFVAHSRVQAETYVRPWGGEIVKWTAIGPAGWPVAVVKFPTRDQARACVVDYWDGDEADADDFLATY